MRIINLGSLNIDKVYTVPHFVTGGETILCEAFETFCGGKGLNQSVALARAGGEVYHIGAIGTDGEALRNVLQQAGAHTEHLQVLPDVSGHAIIQVDGGGQNCIIVFGGANAKVTTRYIDDTLSGFAAGDLLLMQNETSNVAYAIEKAHSLGIKVALNPSPITEELLNYPLHLADYLILNEVEGSAVANIDSESFADVLDALHKKFPDTAIILTVGKAGAYYQDKQQRLHHGIYNVPVVDTTAAGDTFCGYFLASVAGGFSPAEALHNASCASSLAVGKKGAANSIPTWDEVVSSALFSQKP